MRLMTTKLAWNLPIIMLVFLISGISFTKAIEYILDLNVLKVLEIRKTALIHELQGSNDQDFSGNRHLSKIYDYDIHKVVSPYYGNVIKDTLVYNKPDNTYLQLKSLTFGTTINGINYKLTVRKSIVDYQEIIEVVTGIMIIMFVVLILVLNGSFYMVSKIAWKPFYRTLDKVLSYRLNSGEEIHFEQSGIKEFDQLNETLQAMTSMIRSEYRQLKDFTEHISHELQTPVTIIKARTDILLQSTSLNSDDLRTAASIRQAADRLAMMTEGLVTLTRIDSGWFIGKVSIELSHAIKQKLSWYEELIELRQIEISISGSDKAVIEMNERLWEMLIGNLLSNAIKHNKDGGFIDVVIRRNQLQISNSMNRPAGETNSTKLMERYYSENPQKGLGLGMSIIESICRTQGFEFYYEEVDQVHKVSIRF